MNWFDNLKKIKCDSGMSTREIADKSGLPEPTLEKIFSGATKNPGVNTIQALVHAMGYTLNDIDSCASSFSVNLTIPGEQIPGTDPLRSTLLQNFDQLNQEGQERLVETSDDMVSSGKYIKIDPAELGKTKEA